MASTAPAPAAAEVLRAFGTIRQMLQARGLVEDADGLLISGDASDASILTKAEGGPVFHVDLPSCGVRVVFDLNPKFKMTDVKALLAAGGDWQTFGGTAPHTCLLVVRERPVQGKVVEELTRGAIDVQLFLLKELQFNLMRHALVPDHEPIRDEADIEGIMRRYGLKSRYQLPLILSMDPVARHLALKPGQLVRISRPSPSSGTYVMYRCCQRA